MVKPAAQTKTTAKRKPIAASTKSQSDKTAALQKAAGKPTRKHADTAKKSAVAITKKKLAVVAAKAKPKKKTAS